MILKHSFKPLCLLLSFLLFSCADEPERDSWDVTPEWTFTEGIEGPATDADGTVYAVNFSEQGTIGMLRPGREAELFLDLPSGSIGNGIGFDRMGDMYIADYVKHRVYRVKKGSANAEIWAEESEMNQPNDLCVHPGGNLYLSDPDWTSDSGMLWRVDPEGRVHLLEKGMGTTNGITLSPDGRFLYVNESVQRRIWKYRLGADGTPQDKELFVQFEDFGLDGMRCDVAGNLYIARFDKGTLAVFNPEGELLKEYRLKGRKPSNLTFAGPENKTIYITMADRGCFEAVEALQPGAQPNY